MRNDFKYVTFDTDLLEDPNSRIPPASIVSKLSVFELFEGYKLRKFDPSALRPLLSAILYLEDAEWWLCSPLRRLRQLRRRIRSELATTLLQLNTPNLTRLYLYWEDRDPRRQSFEPDRCADPDSSGSDCLSLALRHLADLPSLTTLNLKGCHSISPAMFESPPTPFIHSRWPSLRQFCLEASIITPSGQWYFTGDPDADPPDRDWYDDGWVRFYPFDSAPSDTDSSDLEFVVQDNWECANGMKPIHQFRGTPDDEVFSPLIAAMIQEVEQEMRKLERLEFVMGAQTSAVFSAEYYAPGQKPQADIKVDDDALFHDQHASEFRWMMKLSGSKADVQWRPGATLTKALTNFTKQNSLLLTVGTRSEIL